MSSTLENKSGVPRPKRPLWKTILLLACLPLAGYYFYILYATEGFYHPERFPQLPQFSKGSLTSPVALRATELKKIIGSGWNQSPPLWSGPSPTFAVDVYNGTEWTITGVDVTLTNKKTSNSRRFRLSPLKVRYDRETQKTVDIKSAPMQPYSKGVFNADIGDFLAGAEKSEWSWALVEAFGFRE